VLINGPCHTINLTETGMVCGGECFQSLSNSIRDVFPFILAPVSFAQKPPATCVNLLIDTLLETGELDKAIVSVGISPSHSSCDALATMELHWHRVCNGHERNYVG
jgi:hypothetical protein